MPVDAPPFDPSQPFDALSGGGAQQPRTQTLANLNVDAIDPNLRGLDYLKQWPVEIQSAARAFMSGDVMPTGNPRNNNISSLAKTVAQKVAMDLGQPNLADDTLYSQRRKMRTDLGSSSPNTMGGIISNGKSAFEHLANLSDKYSQLGNYNGPDVPGGGTIARIGNYIGDSLLPTGHTLDLLQQANANATHYGQEATKFYAGSGGGEAERLAALKDVNPATATSDQMAGFLQTEKELMLERLAQKQAQIKDTLGDQYLQQHPIMTPDLQNTLSRIDANIVKLRGGGASAPQAPAQPQASALPQGWSVQVH